MSEFIITNSDNNINVHVHWTNIPTNIQYKCVKKGFNKRVEKKNWMEKLYRETTFGIHDSSCAGHELLFITEIKKKANSRKKWRAVPTKNLKKIFLTGNYCKLLTRRSHCGYKFVTISLRKNRLKFNFVYLLSR